MDVRISDEKLKELLCSKVSMAKAETLAYIGEAILGLPVGSLEYEEKSESWVIRLDEEPIDEYMTTSEQIEAGLEPVKERSSE